MKTKDLINFDINNQLNFYAKYYHFYIDDTWKIEIHKNIDEDAIQRYGDYIFELRTKFIDDPVTGIIRYKPFYERVKTKCFFENI